MGQFAGGGGYGGSGGSGGAPGPGGVANSRIPGAWLQQPQAQPHASWLISAQGVKFSDFIVSSRHGPPVVEGLFSRVFSALRDASTAEGSAGGSGDGGGDAAARLADLLRQHCPDFFSESTRLRATALCDLKRARHRDTPSQERAVLARRALELALSSVEASSPADVIASWPSAGDEPPLQQIAVQLRELGAYVGVAVLLLQAAAAAEGGPDRVRGLPLEKQVACARALVFPPPPGAPPAPGSDSTVFRARCYSELLVTLGTVMERGSGAGGAALPLPLLLRGAGADVHLPHAAGGGGGMLQATLGQGQGLTLGELAAPHGSNPQFEALLGDSLNVYDALWHELVYEWLLRPERAQLGGQALLLRLETPYIEGFLQRLANPQPTEQQPVPQPNPELLKDYLLKRGKHERTFYVLPCFPLFSRLRSHLLPPSHPSFTQRTLQAAQSSCFPWRRAASAPTLMSGCVRFAMPLPRRSSRAPMAQPSLRGGSSPLRPSGSPNGSRF